MPQLRTWEIQLPDGRTIEIQSAEPPTPAVIARAQAKLAPAVAPAAPAPTVDIFGADFGPVGSPMKKAGRFALEALPAVGATAAVLGGPAGLVPGLIAAGLGGAAGAAGRDVIKAGATQDPVPNTLADVALTMASEGGEQVLAEAGGRAAVKGLKALAPGIKRSAQVGYAKTLGAKPGTAGLYEKTIPEALERGIAGTEKTLVEKGRAGLDAALTSLDDVLSQIPADTKVETADILGRIEEAKRRFATTEGVIMSQRKQAALLKSGAPPPAQPFAQLPGKAQEKAVEALEEVQAAIEAHGPYVTFSTLRKMRQVWDRSVAEAGGYVGKKIKEASRLNAEKAAANSIREEFGKTFPDLDRVNAEVSFWKRFEDIMEEKAKSEYGGDYAGGFGTYILAGGATTGKPLEGIKLVAVRNTLQSLFRSPAWGTYSGVWKNRLADLLASGNEKQAGTIAASMLRFPTFYQEMPSMTPGDTRTPGPLFKPPPRGDWEVIPPPPR